MFQFLINAKCRNLKPNLSYQFIFSGLHIPVNKQKQINHKIIILHFMIKLYKTLIITCLCFACNQETPNKQVTNSLKKLREQSQQSLDTLINRIAYIHSLYEYADSISNFDTSSNGLIKLDSLILLYPNDDKFYIYRGSWYFNKKEYQKSLKEYDLVNTIAGYSYPVLQDKKAQVYVKLNKLTDAITLYRAASLDNKFYYQKLGHTFLLNNTMDSAIYYYSLYLQSYPDDLNIKYCLDSLNKILNIKK